MRTSVLPALLLLANLACAAPAPAVQDASTPKGETSTDATAPLRFETHHQGTFHGVEVAYRAVVAETILANDEGKPEASLWSIAYLKEDVPVAEERPVTFLWNGGPGSSSVWLHMGAFGPKRVDVPSDARDDGGPPYGLLDNPGAFLDVSDVVFVDPVGTGFSHAIGPSEGGVGEGKDFWGLRQDARSVARFIRHWISAEKRWNSPKFIGGESYGTTRSAAVVHELEGGFDDVAINGILLISTILDFSLDSDANELSHVVNLPTLAATAHYHGLAGEGVPVAAFVEQARQFARNEYAHALLQGNALPADERARVRARLAVLTGLSETYLEHANLRVRLDRFQKELLRERGLTVGRLDGRYTGRDLDSAGESPDEDPSFYGIDGAYATALNAYLRGPLGADVERPYRIIGGLSGRWDWGEDFYTDVAPHIGEAMRQNSGLRVLVASGYYDMATPFHAAEYSLSRAGLVSERLHFAYYEAGHMMYVNHAALAQLQDDVHAFLLETLGR